MTLPWMRRVAAGVLVIAAALVTGAAPAGAHPLGNFTVNRYARVEVSGSLLRVYYVLDEAELPAFQDRDALAEGHPQFIAGRAAEIGAHLRVVANGTPLVLRRRDSSLSQPPGQGGLRTLRLAILFDTDLPAPPAGADGGQLPLQVAVEDLNEPDRIGWREMVVVARGDAVVSGSSAPSRDLTDELRNYPTNLIQAPLHVERATFAVVPGTVAAPALPLAPAPAQAPKRAGGSFTALIDRHDLTPVTLAGMLAVAFLFGATHALAPGHGKTVMAAYLVGTRGRPVDAVLLGVIVSVMHTGSVLLLGFALFRVGRTTPLDRVYPILTIASGAAVALIGAWLVDRRLRRARAATVVVSSHAGQAHDQHGDDEHDHHAHEHHAHAHHEHGHDQDGGHGHQHGPGGHTHALPEGVPPLSRRGLAVLATSGGIIPSPSAIVVLVAAFTLGRTGLGLGLIGAFSVGLAATLTAVGLALVYGRRIVERRGAATLLRLLPVASAAALIVLGAILVVQGVRRLP